ncbi:retrovirus-related pol polyprotein from transposon TNT 1-94 [Tanacetum coccineum]
MVPGLITAFAVAKSSSCPSSEAYHNLWDVIVNGDLKEELAPTTRETSAPPAPKTAKQLSARRNQERVKSILLLELPDEYLLKFHNVVNAKSLWEAIKSRFGGNVESKKMQKNVLKHVFEIFSNASNESLDKAYDRFQKLISQLEISLIMRNKPDIDEIDIDDLYNNLRVYEDELKRSSGSNSASQNLAFLSFENTGSTNEVSTAGGINQVPSTPCAHDIAYSFLAQPTTSPQLENEDFQQMDGDDLEELDLRWQVAMLTVRVKKSGRSQGRRSYGDNGRNNVPTNESSSQALVAQDGVGGYDWSNDFEVEPVNYALMAISFSSSSSSSDSEVQKCSKCLESFKYLQKNYDTEREKHNKVKLEIRGYEIALESLESRIIGHEKNELAWGLEKQLNHNVKIIRCDNGTEFKNHAMNEFCAKKGIKREFSIARTPQQNGVAERKNMTLIEAARTMLADSLLPIPFWAEAVNTACYVLNRVLVTKPQNKTPYELLIGKSPSISFMRPFGCPLTILNTLDSLGKFDGKSDEGYLLGYSTSSKAFRVYNKRTKRVEENLHINFLEDQPNVAGTGTQDSYIAGSSGKDIGPTQEYILLPLQPHRTRIPVKDVVQDAQEKPSENASSDKDVQDSEDVADKEEQHQMQENEKDLQDELEMMITQELATKAMISADLVGCDNEKEFKNHAMNEFCVKKGIKRGFSVARTPQQNGVAERENITLIEATRTMLADSLLPIPFWAEAVNTTCYVLNRVLVTKPQNKTPYELLIGKSPSISFMRPFGCPLTILNTLDSLGKFDGKSDEGYLLGYSTSSKAFRVYNKRTKRVEENLHINFLEDQPNVAGTGPNWMFDLDFLTNSMNYIPVSVENQVNVDAGTQDSYIAGSSRKDIGPTQEYILLLLQPHRTRIPVKDVVHDAQEKPSENDSSDKDV